MSRLWFRWAVLTATLLGTGPALAQTSAPWLESHRATQGIGIRAGQLELHPGVAGEVGYDSNFFQGSGIDPTNFVVEPIVPTLQLRVTPSLAVQTLSPQRKLTDGETAAPPRIDFRSRLSARLTQLYSLDSAYQDQVSLRTLFGADLDSQVAVLPNRPWGADIGLNFSRIEQPNNDPAVTGNASDRNSVGGSFGVRYQPGGGVLQWSLGYQAQLVIFDDAAFGLNRVSHGPRTTGRWKFLPRTALLYDGSVSFVQHTQPNSRQTDASPISSQIGLNGLISPRIALLVMGGWKAMFYEADRAGNIDDFDGPVGRAELTWYLGAPPEQALDTPQVGASTVAFGYQRDVSPSSLGNFLVLDRFYADLAYSVGGVLLLGLNTAVAVIDHSVPRNTSGEPLTLEGGGLVELRPSARFSAEYRLSKVFALVGRTEFTASPSNRYVAIESDGQVVANDNLKYFRFTTFVGARWFM